MLIVVGSSGWIGRSLIEKAVASRIPTYGLGRCNDPEVELKRAFSNLTNHTSDCVINLASPGTSKQSQQDYLSVTSIITELCLQASIRYFHIGSAAEFGNSDMQLIRDDAPLNPLSPYGKVKARASEIALNGDSTVLRPFNVFGPNQPQGTPIGEWSKRLTSGLDFAGGFPIRDGSLIRDFVSISFVASVILTVSLQGTEQRNINICSGIGIPYRMIVEQMISLLDLSVAVTDFHEGGIPSVVGDPSLLKSIGVEENPSPDVIARTVLGLEISGGQSRA